MTSELAAYLAGAITGALAIGAIVLWALDQPED